MLPLLPVSFFCALALSLCVHAARACVRSVCHFGVGGGWGVCGTGEMKERERGGGCVGGWGVGEGGIEICGSQWGDSVTRCK